jgi:hypothetical protein
MAKYPTGVPIAPTRIGKAQDLSKSKNKQLSDYDGHLVKYMSQMKDLDFKRRYNVAYVAPDGTEHFLFKWDVISSSATPDKIINMVLQNRTTLETLSSGKVKSSIADKKNSTLFKSIQKLSSEDFQTYLDTGKIPSKKN